MAVTLNTEVDEQSTRDEQAVRALERAERRAVRKAERKAMRQNAPLQGKNALCLRMSEIDSDPVFDCSWVGGGGWKSTAKEWHWRDNSASAQNRRAELHQDYEALVRLREEEMEQLGLGRFARSDAELVSAEQLAERELRIWTPIAK